MTSEHTDTNTLLDLAAAAVHADIKETAEREADGDTETLEWADRFTRSTLGEAAANVLGQWLPVDQAVCPDDTSQAVVGLAPRVNLVFSLHCEDGPSLAVEASCGTCYHHRTQKISSLLDLARVLQRQGVR